MSDEANLVSSYFASNPTATPQQVATAVQSIGGLTPALSSALANYYGTSTENIGQQYQTLTAPVTGPSPDSGVATTPAPLSAPIYTSPAQVLNGLQSGALNSSTVGNALQQVNQASAPFTTASQVLTGLQSGVLNSSNVGNALGQVASVGISPPSYSMLGSAPLSLGNMAMNQGITHAQGSVAPAPLSLPPKPYSSSLAPATASDSNPYFNQTYNALQYGNTKIATVDNNDTEGGGQKLALLDSKGNPLPPDNIVDYGNGIYDLQIGSGAGGGRNHILVKVDPKTGYVTPVENYNSQVNYQGGDKGGFFNQAAKGFSSLPGVNMAVAIAAPELYPYLQGMNAVVAGMVLTTGLKLIPALKKNPMGFAMRLCLVLLTLVKIGLLDAAKLSKFRMYWVVAGLAIAGFITPDGNPFTMVLMFLPLHLLYEISVLIAWWWERKERKAAAIG